MTEITIIITVKGSNRSHNQWRLSEFSVPEKSLEDVSGLDGWIEEGAVTCSSSCFAATVFEKNLEDIVCDGCSIAVVDEGRDDLLDGSSSVAGGCIYAW